MELDTASSISLISEETWKEHFQAKPLEAAIVVLKTYTGQKCESIETNDSWWDIPYLYLWLQVRDPHCLAETGLSALNWTRWGYASTHCQQTLTNYWTNTKIVFSSELGTLKGIYAKLILKPDAEPNFFKPRPVPYTLHDAIERDLERLKSLRVIEKVSYSDWAAPIVPIPKPDGSIHICGNYKVTINPLLKVNQFPVPKVEDVCYNKYTQRLIPFSTLTFWSLIHSCNKQWKRFYKGCRW